MKRQLTALAMVLGMVLSFGLNAQEAANQKMGHINADQLLQMMPETKAAQAQLEEYSKQLEKDLTEMESEYQTKGQKYVEERQVMTDLTRRTREKELQELQNRIAEYSQSAQEDLQNKQVELLTPIIEKATAAVKKVADDNGFSYIMDSSQSKAVLIYTQGGIDIMPLVKKELGLQ